MGASPLDAVWSSGMGLVWALIGARSAGVCLTAPVLAAPGFALRFRIVLAGVLAAWLAPIVAPMIAAPAIEDATVWLIVNELLIGGLIGWSASLVVAGARQAGDVVAAQAGLSVATLFDPESGDESTALGHLYGFIALAVFLSLDGPLVMVDALIRSFQAMPAGRLVFDRGAAGLIFGQIAEALSLAVRAAAPPAVALVVAGFAMGWLGRLAPSVPLVALSLPVRAFLGILLVLASLGALLLRLDEAWSGWVFGGG